MHVLLIKYQVKYEKWFRQGFFLFGGFIYGTSASIHAEIMGGKIYF